MGPDDAKVVLASIDEPQGFAVIFERHHARIWRYLARAGGRDAADELAGDVFVTAFAQRGRYDVSRGSVQTWLYGIATNLFRTHARSNARRTRAFGRAIAQHPGAICAIEAADDALAGSQELEQVRSAMRRLSEPHREVLMLSVWEGLSYQEIASALSIVIGTVRSRLARARSELRALTVLGDESALGAKK